MRRGSQTGWIRGQRDRSIPPLAYLGLLMIGCPELDYLPTHLLLQSLLA